MKMALSAGVAAAAVAVLSAPAAQAQTRDQIRIVGSSTVFPYTQAVAEQYAGMTGNPAPVVESTGTGGGMQIFCEGVGPDYPDITGASRAMTESEYQLCQQNGVENVTEVLLGYDGLSVAHSVDAPDMDLTKAQLFQALAAEVPVDGEVVDNPYANWSEIDPSLPDMPITASVIRFTPLAWQRLNSLGFIGREELVMSGVLIPSPAQKSFMPPPEPVDSTTGVAYSLVAPNSSAT